MRKLDKHFKLDKQTKRMMALSSFPGRVYLNEKEQKDANVKLVPLDKKSFKSLMAEGQLSEVEARLTGFDDPFFKPKKEEKTEAGTNKEGVAGNAPSSSDSKNHQRKGKKALKMRKEGE